MDFLNNNPLLATSPQQLLDRVSDEQLSTQLSRFSSETQLHCQTHCQRQTEQGLNENQTLTDDSVKALERQCNKSCIKKLFKAYHMYNQFNNQGVDHAKRQ
eukprot:403335400